jgi:hypothetical protein
VHLSSFALFGFATVHGALAGSDATNLVFVMTMSMLVGVTLFAIGYRVVARRAGPARAARPHTRPTPQ